MRPSRRAAVCVTSPAGCEISPIEALGKARKKINLEDLGVEKMKLSRTLTGGVLIGIEGAEKKEKAKGLAGKMEEALNATEVKVTVPTMKAHFRITRMDGSVRPDEVAHAVARKGG